MIKKEIIPRDSYYLSKILNEKILQLSGLNYVILRPHNIYGPRMGYRHVIPELFSRISKSKKKLKFTPLTILELSVILMMQLNKL